MRDISTNLMIVTIVLIMSITFLALVGTCALYMVNRDHQTPIEPTRTPTPTSTPIPTPKIKGCYEHNPHQREINGYITLRCSL